MRKEMHNNTIERQENFPGRLGTLLCMWFLAGMPLSMLLSGIYSFAALPFPPLLFFLSGMIYLTGGLLGGIWSKGNFRRRGLPFTDMFVTLFVLMISIVFLMVGGVFVVKGFQHL